MKIQSLAIIFVIIMLPIMIVVSEYVQSEIDTLNNQTSYDSKLISATYDALKAFQINTTNSTTSSISDSKIRDIEASASTFFDSIQNSFGLRGNNSDAIKNYVPAIVYTLYDGYYIYSPYTNDLGTGNLSTYNGSVTVQSGSTYENGESIYGTKPYVYYSSRYTKGTTNDFVITYTLDNYITIQGTIQGEYVNTSGYLLDNITASGIDLQNYDDNKSGVDYSKVKDKYATATVTYNGVEIENEGSLQEVLVDENGTSGTYKYVKINGTKYYYEETTGKVFYMLNNKKTYNPPSNMTADECIAKIQNNSNAKEYYINAYLFTNWVRSVTVLNNLNASDGDYYDEATPDYTIFKKETGTAIEATNSKFNEQRLAVIRKSIETNLSIAIANFNGYSTSTNEFLMPVLKEDEWTKIINNVSIISFLQGLPIGGKVYNGYAIVENSKNEEVVAEDSIYIVQSGDEYYHRVTDTDLITSGQTFLGVYNIDFERKTVTNTRRNSDGSLASASNTYYFYPKENLSCYYCVVNNDRVAGYDSLYEYIKNCGNNNLKKAYYTALGRERNSMYKIENEI